MPRELLDAEALLAYIAEHVAYEVESLGAAIAAAKGSPPISPVRRCAIEAFLLHARNLDDFLGRADSRFATDVLGADVAGWTAAQVLEPAARTLIDKMLAHLTTERIEERGRVWPVETMASALVAAIERWQVLLPSGIAADAIRAAASYARDQLAAEVVGAWSTTELHVTTST